MARYSGYGAKNVGWLKAGEDFPKNPPDDDLLDALWETIKHPAIRTRGLHECDQCNKQNSNEHYKNQTLLLGSNEIRIFHKEGDIFAAPNMIFHYVYIHHYNPPLKFREAVLYCAQNLDWYKLKSNDHIQLCKENPLNLVRIPDSVKRSWLRRGVSPLKTPPTKAEEPQ